MDEEIFAEVGKRIRAVRKHLQINQKDFAAHLGISTAHLSGMENGRIKPSFEFLYKAEEIFNINLSYLITGKGTIFPLWERPTIKMCEGLLKANGQEFRELIQDMFGSSRVYRAVVDHFALYKLQQSDWIEGD